MCGRNIPPAWYVNSQLRGLYQPSVSLWSFSCVDVSPSAELVASLHLYLLDNPSHVKDDIVDTLQAAVAFARWGERFVRQHPNKFRDTYMPREFAHWTSAKTLKRSQTRSWRSYGEAKYLQDLSVFTHLDRFFHLQISPIRFNTALLARYWWLATWNISSHLPVSLFFPSSSSSSFLKLSTKSHCQAAS